MGPKKKKIHSKNDGDVDPRLQKIAEEGVLRLATEQISREDAVFVTVSMLNILSGIALTPKQHKSFMEEIASTMMEMYLPHVTDNSKEAELAVALASYIDPTLPEFDLEFANSILSTRPSWLSEEEKKAILSANEKPSR